MGNRVINYNVGADPHSMFDAPADVKAIGVRRVGGVPVQDSDLTVEARLADLERRVRLIESKSS